jgi:hypothetical protein
VIVASLAALVVACGQDDEAPPDQASFEVLFALEVSVQPLGALQFDVRYLGRSGDWAGAGAGASCAWLLDADLHACNDKGGGEMTCAVVDPEGFRGPIDLMRCGFRSNDEVEVEDFRVRVTDASTPWLAPVRATVIVSDAARTGLP